MERKRKNVAVLTSNLSLNFCCETKNYRVLVCKGIYKYKYKYIYSDINIDGIPLSHCTADELENSNPPAVYIIVDLLDKYLADKNPQKVVEAFLVTGIYSKLSLYFCSQWSFTFIRLKWERCFVAQRRKQSWKTSLRKPEYEDWESSSLPFFFFFSFLILFLQHSAAMFTLSWIYSWVSSRHSYITSIMYIFICICVCRKDS